MLWGHYLFIFFLFPFLVAPRGMWNLSSLARDRCASSESYWTNRKIPGPLLSMRVTWTQTLQHHDNQSNNWARYSVTNKRAGHGGPKDDSCPEPSRAGGHEMSSPFRTVHSLKCVNVYLWNFPFNMFGSAGNWNCRKWNCGCSRQDDRSLTEPPGPRVELTQPLNASLCPAPRATGRAALTFLMPQKRNPVIFFCLVPFT